MQTISSLDELDLKLAECDAAQKISDDALRSVFTTFRMDFSARVPADPFSLEYHEFQMALYRRISGREYSPRNEQTNFGVEELDRRPFPYSTGSCKTAGFFTMGVGFLLHSLDLSPGARVVEFGAGWGNTTISMAMVGLDVTAVDVESNFCELLRRRAKRQELNINVVNADFMWAETVDEPFDAAVFFECFHHCGDHMRLLHALRTAVKPGGRVYFGAEPIIPDFPMPWGLRMDGEALWAIRSNGWMELGFNEKYFRAALARAGWTAVKHVFPDIGWAAVWEAQRTDAMEAPAGPLDPIAPPVPSIQPPAARSIQSSGGEAALRAELDAVYRSTSWRLTAPIRALKTRFGR
jgi:2-polyprenyl-3-methyl-5-hydroxy-6-metoxy-1,4-benzoquinol methylase